MSLDWVDARIIGEMIADCRISYKALAEKLDLTANAVRARLTKLVDAGVITFDVVLSYAQSGAGPALVEVKTDSTVTSDEIIEEFGRHPLIFVINPLPDGQLHLFADYRSPAELADLLQFIRTRDLVIDAQSHMLVTYSGKKGSFTKDQLLVLQTLLDDPRKPITKIADEAGLTARRVRRALQKCYDEETVQFMSRWNPNLGDSQAVCSRIRWAPESSTIHEYTQWLYDTFPERFWYSYNSASQPVSFSVFVVDHIRDMEEIDKALESSPRIEHADAYFMFPSRLYPRPRRQWLEELIGENLG
jgi:DNA-binding Lrp family transcriptional regulator